jgi:hypothetical protein
MADDILWSDSAPGEVGPGINVARVKGERGVLLLHQGAPDWIVDPATGSRVRVSDSAAVADFDCHKCGTSIAGPTLVMFYPSQLNAHRGTCFVYACPHCNQWICGLMRDGDKEPDENEQDWVTFTRRTEDPKLACLESELRRHGIQCRRHGHSFHAPILQVPASQLDQAWEVLTLELDELPDDDPRFKKGS